MNDIIRFIWTNMTWNCTAYFLDARALLLMERKIVLCVYAAVHTHVRSIINQIIAPFLYGSSGSGYPSSGATDSVLLGAKWCNANHCGRFLKTKYSNNHSFVRDNSPHTKIVFALYQFNYNTTDKIVLLGFDWHLNQLCTPSGSGDIASGSLAWRYFFRSKSLWQTWGIKA